MVSVGLVTRDKFKSDSQEVLMNIFKEEFNEFVLSEGGEGLLKSRLKGIQPVQNGQIFSGFMDMYIKTMSSNVLNRLNRESREVLIKEFTDAGYFLENLGVIYLNEDKSVCE